jgi:hypothetical protein
MDGWLFSIHESELEQHHSEATLTIKVLWIMIPLP